MPGNVLHVDVDDSYTDVRKYKTTVSSTLKIGSFHFMYVTTSRIIIRVLMIAKNQDIFL